MTDQANTTQTGQQSSGQPNPSPSNAPGSDGGSNPTATRPEYVPETFWDATTNSVKAQEFTTHIGELAALKAQQDARIAARPKELTGYELKFPDGYTPEVAVAFDETDPRVPLLREFAHKNNWSPAEFSEVLKIEAAAVAAETKAFEAKQAEEIKKLGANGTARVTAAKTWLKGILGDDARTNAFMDRMLLAADIESLEKLQLAFTTQGGSIYSNGGREPPAPPPKSREEILYPSMQRKAS